MNSLTAIAAIFVLATLVEAIMEWLGFQLPTRVKPYAAATLAVLVCVVYDADLPAALGLGHARYYAGPILTGLVIGRGSNYLSILIKRIQTVGVPAQNIANVPDPVPPKADPRLFHDAPAPGEVIQVPPAPGANQTGGTP